MTDAELQRARELCEQRYIRCEPGGCDMVCDHHNDRWEAERELASVAPALLAEVECLRALTFREVTDVPAIIDVAGSKGGVVYAIAVVPDIDMRRLKIGYTEKLGSRLRSYRTANPTAILIGAWDADPHDETRAHSVVDGRINGSEVFQVRDLSAALTALAETMRVAP